MQKASVRPLVPCDGTTPEGIVIEETVHVRVRLAFVHERFQLIIVQDNHTGNAVGLLCRA